MGIINLLDEKKKYSLLDVGLDETAMIAFTLLVAKYWTTATSLAWYWYAIIGVLAVIKPLMTFLKK